MIPARRVLVSIATYAALSLSGPASASDQGGQITTVQQTQSRVFVYLSGTRTTKPACDCCGRWEITGNTAQGQTMISIILTAYAQGRSVMIYGTGSCVSGANDTEGINLVSVP